MRRVMSLIVMVCFTSSLIVSPAGAQVLPLPGTPVGLTPGYQPPVLLGLKVHPENPLLFDFIIDHGQAKLNQEQLKAETEKLVKYFFAALTIPDKESWVNLSPTEKDRIVPDALGTTAMGKTMLEQDYILKQLASSLTNPDEKLGKEFWTDVKNQVQSKLGTTDVPMNTFNKVWIIPQKAEVLEKDGIVVVSKKRLKVMMADEYETMKNMGVKDQSPDVSRISSQVFKENILPNIEKEINEGKNFADVRQVYNSVILAAWYKKALKESLLGKVYADKGKVLGIESGDKEMKQRIYNQYLAAFKKGVYNVIKEDTNGATGEVMPRKYFSGGVQFGESASSVLAVGHPATLLDRLGNLSGGSGRMSSAEVVGAEANGKDGAALKKKVPVAESSMSASSAVDRYKVIAEKNKLNKSLMLTSHLAQAQLAGEIIALKGASNKEGLRLALQSAFQFSNFGLVRDFNSDKVIENIQSALDNSGDIGNTQLGQWLVANPQFRDNVVAFVQFDTKNEAGNNKRKEYLQEQEKQASLARQSLIVTMSQEYWELKIQSVSPGAQAEEAKKELAKNRRIVEEAENMFLQLDSGSASSSLDTMTNGQIKTEFIKAGENQRQLLATLLYVYGSGGIRRQKVVLAFIDGWNEMPNAVKGPEVDSEELRSQIEQTLTALSPDINHIFVFPETRIGQLLQNSGAFRDIILRRISATVVGASGSSRFYVDSYWGGLANQAEAGLEILRRLNQEKDFQAVNVFDSAKSPNVSAGMALNRKTIDRAQNQMANLSASSGVFAVDREVMRAQFFAAGNAQQREVLNLFVPDTKAENIVAQELDSRAKALKLAYDAIKNLPGVPQGSEDEIARDIDRVVRNGLSNNVIGQLLLNSPEFRDMAMYQYSLDHPVFQTRYVSLANYWRAQYEQAQAGFKVLQSFGRESADNKAIRITNATGPLEAMNSNRKLITQAQNQIARFRDVGPDLEEQFRDMNLS